MHRVPMTWDVESRSIAHGNGERRTCGVLVPTPEQVARRRALERIWIALGFVWVIGRVLVAQATVEKYGVNITVFAVLEVLVAWPHSLSAARLVTNLIDRDPTGALPWGVILAGTHIAPELYVGLAGTNMSTGVYVSLIVIVVGLGALAIVGIVQKVAVGRSQRFSPATDNEISSANPVTTCVSDHDDELTRVGGVERALAALIDEGVVRAQRPGERGDEVLALAEDDVVRGVSSNVG